MRISVIVPVYNGERYLPRCLEALRAQTHPDREILLIDDGSTDGTAALCQAFAQSCPDVRYLRKENSGAGHSRNCGLDAASGEYVTFADADDWMGEGLLAGLAEAAERTGADLVIGGYTLAEPDGRMRPHPFAHEEWFTAGERRELLLRTAGALPEDPEDTVYGISVWGRLYRREVIARNGLRFLPEGEVSSEDLLFNLDFIRHAETAAVTMGADYVYRIHPGSLSRQRDPERFARDAALVRAVRERLRDAGIPPEESDWYLRRLLISRARYDLIQEVRSRKHERIRGILECAELREALNGYPWWRLPVTQGIFAWFMRLKWVGGLILLTRLKERILRRSW